MHNKNQIHFHVAHLKYLNFGVALEMAERERVCVNTHLFERCLPNSNLLYDEIYFQCSSQSYQREDILSLILASGIKIALKIAFCVTLLFSWPFLNEENDASGGMILILVHYCFYKIGRFCLKGFPLQALLSEADQHKLICVFMEDLISDTVF